MDTRKQPSDDMEVGRREGDGSYVAPRVTDYGTLREMTNEVGGEAFGMTSANGIVSVPLTMPPPGGDTPGGGTPEGGVPGGAVLPGGGGEAPGVQPGPGGESSPAGDTSGGGVTDVGTGGTSSSELPFTGFPVAVMGALGGAFAAAGTYLRRKLRD